MSGTTMRAHGRSALAISRQSKCLKVFGLCCVYSGSERREGREEVSRREGRGEEATYSVARKTALSV